MQATESEINAELYELETKIMALSRRRSELSIVLGDCVRERDRLLRSLRHLKREHGEAGPKCGCCG